MSKLTEYSKFDHIDSDDESDLISRPDRTLSNETQAEKSLSTSTSAVPTIAQRTTKKHPSIADRYIHYYDGRKIYEWEQSLEEVTLYIDAPPQLPSESPASYISVNIYPNRLQVGLKGNDRFFLDERTFDKVKVKESSWYFDEGMIIIVLGKGFRGQTWEGVLCGHAKADDQTNGIHESIDPFVKQDMQRNLMIERFQEENPGFDFRDATFNGEVPDPRTFMGGVSYNN